MVGKSYIGRITNGFGGDTEGKYISMDIYFAGCSRNPKCEGCHNPSLWSREGYTPIPNTDIIKWAVEGIGVIQALVFMGGEPLDQEKSVLEIAKEGAKIGMVTYLYTGKEIEEVSQDIKDVIDVIIAGPYIPSMANPRGAWPASSNQTIHRKEKENKC